MLLITFLISFVLSATGLTITEPENWAAYNLDELPGFRAIVENENEIPDSVHYSLNGEAFVQVPRLNTDWPTYMQNYVHHGYSESPAPTDNTILWTAPVTGDFHEYPTPVVVEGIVYYPQDHGGDSLYALDAATGEILWKYQVGNTDDAVTVQDGLLYTASGDSVYCLNALSGERIWASGDADWLGSTPVVINDKVFCGTGPQYGSGQPNISYISCLSASDGSNIWTTSLDSCSLVSCMSVWNHYVFVPTWMENEVTSLYALDTETGDVLWENDDSFEGYWDSSPVVVDSVIYINGCDGYSRGIDAISGNTIWTTYFHPATATSAYHDGRLYFANEYYSLYHCVDALSGIHVWGKPGRQHGSSAIADGMVFYGEINGANPGGIRVLDCETGEEVWSFYAEGTEWIAGSPSVTDGIVYIPMHDCNLYAFGTGLKYTYLDDTLVPEVGWNEVAATLFNDGTALATDTISFYINPTGIEFEPSAQLELSCNPNPFSSYVSISFSLSEPGFTALEIYDLAGRCILNLIEGSLAEGNHSVNWAGLNRYGEKVSAGLYLCRIQSGGVIETTGMCLLR